MSSFPPSSSFESAVDDRLRHIERELGRIRRGTPGMGTIAGGVLVGLILYSVLGVIITMLCWGLIIGTMTAAAAGTARSQGSSQPQQAPAVQAIPSSTPPPGSSSAPRAPYSPGDRTRNAGAPDGHLR